MADSEPTREDEAIHRLKNQLSIILGFGELLLEDCPTDDPRRRDIGEILKAARDAMAEIPGISRRLT